MATELHSFMDIFDAEFDDDGEKVVLNKISIPIIQRDYAQGRTDSDVNRVRMRFLESLYNAVTDTPITLDFVYGDIDRNGVMTPLDGQQRLTTLFLLHWYAAKKENIPKEQYVFLNRFSYETRYSSRYFCTELLNFNPSFKSLVSNEIINQAWFPLDWKKDPTINSMLVMIDAIDEQFKDVKDIWGSLSDRAITFYFLPIKDIGLTDEIYIKMNSRGKPLTLFEHFKAELEREIRKIDDKIAERIITKIDRTWTDLLWKYRNSGSGTSEDFICDDEFLRYFKFVCDIICYKNGESPQGYSNDEFDLLKRYFSISNIKATENILLFESFFDCWCNIDGYDNPSDFLSSFMGYQHEQGKIIVEGRNEINIFKDCLQSYSDKTGSIRQFPLNRIVLLYAIIVYLRHQHEVTKDEFIRRIRIVNNLIRNSEDEISDRTDRNRIPAILAQVDSIIFLGKIDDAIENSFNVNQLQEEKEKAVYLSSNPNAREQIFLLEDHPMLYGQIGIIGLDNIAYTDRFISLFKCKLENIDCALMSIGNYGQMERNKWRYQFASKSLLMAWTGLFHKSSNSGFSNTSNILIKLLASNKEFTDEILLNTSESFILECEKNHSFTWRYYYVKYPVFRQGYYGKLSNDNAAAYPYMFSVMQTKTQWSQNTYMPFLKEADEAHLSKDSMGQRLTYGDFYIICQNSEYQLCRDEDNSIADTIKIKQDDRGIDQEDRIILLKNYIKARF